MQRIETVTIKHSEVCTEEFAHVILGREHHYAHRITLTDSKTRRKDSMFDVITEDDFMSIMASVVSTKDNFISVEVK